MQSTFIKAVAAPFLSETSVKPDALAYQLLADDRTLLTIPVPPFSSPEPDTSDIELIYNNAPHTPEPAQCVEPFMFVFNFR